MLVVSTKGNTPLTRDLCVECFHEIRLDYMPHSEIEEFLFKVKLDSRTILTIRHESEGGQSKLSIKEKLDIIKPFAIKHDCLIDLEYNLFIVEQPAVKGLNVILSYHNFTKFDEDIILGFLNVGSKLDCRYLKLCVPIDSYSKLTWLEKNFKTCPKQILFAGLGKLGKLSRILYKHINARATYIANDTDCVVPEQLTFAEVEQFNLTRLTKNTAIGGLLGGEQVVNSIGLHYYNEYFLKNNFDAVYLPFSTDNFEDFWSWLNLFKSDNKVYGISVTMPYKNEVREKARTDNPVNIVYFERDKIITSNTDQFALKKALFILDKKGIETILIYGSGAMAELATVEASIFGEVHIMCRDKEKQSEMCKRYSLKEGDLSFKYDLVVNCTPLGLDGTNLFSDMSIILPRMLIDLPYSVHEISSNVNYEQFEHVVDGIQFWKWQALPQLAIFIQVLKDSTK